MRAKDLGGWGWKATMAGREVPPVRHGASSPSTLDEIISLSVSMDLLEGQIRVPDEIVEMYQVDTPVAFGA